MEPGEQKIIESTSKIQPHLIKPEKEEDDEEEEDLFEINLEIFNEIPPPQYCWESYFTATSDDALLANCLLPIADVSCAVPMLMRACDALLLWPVAGEDQPVSFSGDFMIMSQCYKEMKV